ncbi:hypothetical protein ABBQ38_002763 [Trebouxia sp. C0009 RCD-2024]
MFSMNHEADLLARDGELEERTRDLVALPAASMQDDSNVRQAIEEVLARVNLADSQDASQVEEQQHSTESAVEQKGTDAKPSKRAGSNARSVLPPRVRRTNSGKPQPPIADTEVEGVGIELEVPNHPEATIRLHKARIKSLTAEVAAAQTALKDRSGLLTQAEKQLSEMHKEKAAWLKTQKAQQTQIDRLQKAADDAKHQLDSKENIVKELGRDGSKLDKERRQSEIDAKARDVRLQRALEEVERFKALLQEQRVADKDQKDVSRSEYSRVFAENKKLERQKNELVVAFKKQLKLIDILKRQKIHLEAARLLTFTEDEFMKAIGTDAH